MKSMYNALDTLYTRAQEQMTLKELENIGTIFLGSAVSMAQDASTVLEGIACLVSSEDDAREKGLPISGCLQNAPGIFDTLCLAAAKFDLIAGMVEIGSEAKFRAGQMRSKEVQA